MPELYVLLSSSYFSLTIDLSLHKVGRRWVPDGIVGYILLMSQEGFQNPLLSHLPFPGRPHTRSATALPASASRKQRKHNYSQCDNLPTHCENRSTFSKMHRIEALKALQYTARYQNLSTPWNSSCLPCKL